MRYEMHGDKVVVSADVQKAARLKYHLSGDEEFLGCIKGFVFYWKSFNASRVYWKEISTGVERSAKMPSGVIDIYGVTQGIKKDVGFVVFRKSPGIIHYAPYTHDFIEISL